MKSEKIKEYFYKTILSILFILVAHVTYRSIVYRYRSGIEIKPMIIILGIIICIFVFIRLKKLISKIDEKKSNLLAVVMCVLFFIGLSIFGSKITAVPTFDLSDIQKEVQIMLDNGGKFVDEEDYFAIYKAQQPLAILIYYIYRIGIILGVSNLRVFATIINSLFIAVAAFFTYLCVKKLKDYKLALITLIFFVINPVFYLYSSWFYTDTFCMPFVVIAIYLFIVAMKNENKKKTIISLIFSGIMLAIGFKIRVVVAILLIGMIMGMLLNNKFNKKTVLNIICLFIGFIIGILIYTLISLQFNTQTDKNKQIPITHWIMMSVKAESYGRWNEIDYKNTLDKSTYEEKIKFNIDSIKKRLQELGIKGWINLTKSKLSMNWANGNYDYMCILENVEQINNIYEYISGNKRVFLNYYCQILKATVMFIFLISVAKEIYKRDTEKNFNVIYISIFGAFMFYMMWEVNARYSLTFLPWIMLLFGIGIAEIEKILDIKKLKYNVKNGKKICINIEKVIRTVIIFVMVSTLFLIAVNYSKLTVDKEMFWDKIVVVNTNDTLDTKNVKISDKTMGQTFKTSKKFNSIAIRFRKEDTKDTTNYQFKLYNSKGELIYQENFNSDDITDDTYKTFSFKYIIPKEKEVFTMQITSEDATDDNSIGLWAMCKNKFSIYPDGKATLNGEFYDIDWMFKVQNENVRTYVSKKVYIILSIIIIGLEVFGFYPYLFAKKKHGFHMKN